MILIKMINDFREMILGNSRSKEDTECLLFAFPFLETQGEWLQKHHVLVIL